MTDVEKLLALEEIKQLKARYFRCMDKKDWKGYLAVFTPDATLDSSESSSPTDYRGEPLLPGGPATPPNPAWRHTDIVKFVDELSQMLNPVSTCHHGHMSEIEFTSPTTAKGIWSMEDMLRWPEGSPRRHMHGYGHYEETYERLPVGWRIKTLKLTRVRIDFWD